MSDAALLGVPRDFIWKGKVYKVCFRDLFIELAFADWVSAEAGLALARMKPKWPPEFYRDQMKIFNSQLIGKKIRWGSDEVNEASWSEEGRRHLLYLKMTRGIEHGGEIVEDRSLIDEIAKDEVKYVELCNILLEQDYPFLLEQEKAKKVTKEEKPSSLESSDPSASSWTPNP